MREPRGFPQGSDQAKRSTILAYAALGLSILPLHTPQPDGSCSCPLGTDCGRNTGKHPRVLRGHADATTDAAQIGKWIKQWPDANWGARVDTSGLIVVDTDSPEGLKEARARGLPRTAKAKTGGGPGRYHFYYRRPEGCPAKSTTIPGCDIKAGPGFTVLPPGLHLSGKRYRWRVPLPDSLDELTEAPAWVVELVREAASPGTARIKGGQRGVRPKRLKPRSRVGYDYWFGYRKAYKPDGQVDRSKTLWWIAVYLDKEGHSLRAIAASVAERDLAFSFHRYSYDPREYLGVAADARASNEKYEARTALAVEARSARET